MAVTLHKVLESEKTIIRNLYSLYLHDLSRFTTKLDIGEDGAFHFDELDQFWNVQGLSPFFIKDQDQIVGFILLLERPLLKKNNDYGINDLFILNKYKGQGFAKQAIGKLFEEKQGTYFVIQVLENKGAITFWKKLYHELNIQFDEKQDLIDDEPCIIQTFSI